MKKKKIIQKTILTYSNRSKKLNLNTFKSIIKNDHNKINKEQINLEDFTNKKRRQKDYYITIKETFINTIDIIYNDNNDIDKIIDHGWSMI